MAAPEKVLELTERFERNIQAYTQGKYNETQARREFIDPFFKALGWDVDNEQGYAEAYKDVVHEDAIKVGRATKAPDYSFRIGGVRKFFVEAKKPSIDIKEDTHPAYQLRRYAWSAKLPLSILTDFEELAVYDCRMKPEKTDKASKARVMYLTYTDYIERWEELRNTFSREAILKGAFDKYAESHKAKRGTAEVDVAFLHEIERWRELLARNIALRNPQLTRRELNFVVQRTIDRIIFLRICEDRGIESYGKLMALLNGSQVYERMLKLFYQADDRYNSGIFHFKQEKDRLEIPDTLSAALQIDDKVLKDILKNIYYPDSPYEFSVLSSDILGQVYEQFLGKIIRLTAGHQAKVEDKPEVKKAGGVFYTPTYIVEYIVQNTVGALLKGKTIKQAERLKILDPSCGSGSFLLGAYQYLLDWHRDFYLNNDLTKWTKGRRPRLYQNDRGEWKLTIDERKRILLNNVYGTDIDTQAVEVTKLSLLLKVLEGEDEQTLNSQLTLFQKRVLPDLSKNIKCGNSLIGSDFYDGQQLTLLDEEELYRINVFDWEKEFSEIIKKGGFDVVIGNPPYVVLSKEIHSSQELDYLNTYTVAQYKTDLFHLFLQRGIELLKTDGLFGYIVPNPWLTLKFTENLRRYILKECRITEVVVFNHLVFQSAKVYTSLVFFQKGRADQESLIGVKNVSEACTTAHAIASTEATQVLQSTWESNDGAQFETRLVGEVGELVMKLLKAWKPLGQVARASLGCQAYNSSKHTQEQIKNRVFHASQKVGDEYLPELAGRDVSRYLINRQKGEWIKYGSWLHDYRTMDWLQGARILVREIPGKPPYRIQACYVEETYCNYKTILNVNPNETTAFSMKYLCGLLNSRLISFLYPYMSNKMLAQSFPRLSVGDLKKLPIRTIDCSNPQEKESHDRLVDLVDQMLTLQKQILDAKIPQTQTLLKRQHGAVNAQIDKLVYKLYGLTDKDIQMVEASG